MSDTVQRIKEIVAKVTSLSAELDILEVEAVSLAADLQEGQEEELTKWAVEYERHFKERLEAGADPRQLELPF